MPVQKNAFRRAVHLAILTSFFLINSNFTSSALAGFGRPSAIFTISGRVLEAKTQKPIAAAAVKARLFLNNTAFSTTTDSEGYYQLKFEVRRVLWGYFYLWLDCSKDGCLKDSRFFQLKLSRKLQNININLDPITKDTQGPSLEITSPQEGQVFK